MEQFSRQGDLYAVPAGSGFLGAAPIALVWDTCPSGQQVYIEKICCRAQDIDLTQISFAFRRNGVAILSNTQLQGTMFDTTKEMLIRQEFTPGFFDIVAYNLSGTSLTNAIAAVTSLCQASWYGHFLPAPKPLKMPHGSLWSRIFQ